MAGKGLTIPLSLDPREWLRGIKVVERSLESMEDDLEEVEDAGDKLERALEDNFKDAAKDAEKAFGKMGKSAKDDFGKIGRAADDVERDLDDIESEANQSAKEFGASFRGDPVEALEEVQGYLSEIVAVKLPGFTGAIATAAGGAALGLLIAGVEKWREKQQRIQELATDYLSTVRDEIPGAVSQLESAYDGILSKMVTMKFLEEASARDTLDLANLAAVRGESLDEYVHKLITGELKTQDELRGVQEEKLRVEQEILALENEGVGVSDDQLKARYNELAALGEQENALQRVGGTINENVSAYQLTEEAIEATGKTILENQERQRGLNRVAAEGLTPAEKLKEENRATYDALRDAGAAAGTLREGLRDLNTGVPWASFDQKLATMNWRLANGVSQSKDLKYWLDQASQVNVRVAGVTGQGGPTQ